VRVFEPANTRSDLVSGVASRIARPTLISLPVLAILVWLSIGWSLRPLKTLSDAIRVRDINRLEPVDIGRAPKEVRPLVDAINLVLSRLRRSIERERAFTADAAHELKTPLAAIKVQAQVALAEPDAILRQLAIRRVVQGVDRTTRLVEQLLLLARLDVQEKLSARPLNPTAIAKDALLANEGNAHYKSIRVTLAGDPRAEIDAEPVLIGILLDNLLDNAIKYGRTGGSIEVEVQRAYDRVHLAVRDDGPGVAHDELALLTNRFFRAADVQAAGSGLGLSIVARIAEHFDAKLNLSAGIGGKGLAVKLSFPAYEKFVEVP
jgi:two-component system sensor histidine kinase QseC